MAEHPDCRACERDQAAGPFARRFIVCPTCGNKRCPKASHHGNACTGSNDAGQPGSDYGIDGPIIDVAAGTAHARAAADAFASGIPEVPRG